MIKCACVPVKEGLHLINWVRQSQIDRQTIRQTHTDIRWWKLLQVIIYVLPDIKYNSYTQTKERKHRHTKLTQVHLHRHQHQYPHSHSHTHMHWKLAFISHYICIARYRIQQLYTNKRETTQDKLNLLKFHTHPPHSHSHTHWKH